MTRVAMTRSHWGRAVRSGKGPSLMPISAQLVEFFLGQTAVHIQGQGQGRRGMSPRNNDGCRHARLATRGELREENRFNGQGCAGPGVGTFLTIGSRDSGLGWVGHVKPSAIVHGIAGRNLQ